MSEFKFACPICGQHITCERDKAGSHMECPTCFREIIVPQPPVSEDSKFILTASEAHERPLPQFPAPETPVRKTSPARDFLLWGAALVILASVLGAVFAFRDRLFKPGAEQAASKTLLPEAAASTSGLGNDTNWTLDLEGVTPPDTPAAGRVAGRSFTCERATLHAGTLNLRQGPTWPPDVGVTIYIVARRTDDLAGKLVYVTPNDEKPPRVAVRWKDAQGQPVTKNITVPYALRVDFGQVSSNHMTGSVYLCIADTAQSCVAGTFDAEIRPPAPPRSHRPSQRR